MEVVAQLAAGLAQALQPVNFLMVLLGLAIGIVAGALANLRAQQEGPTVSVLHRLEASGAVQ